MGDWVNIPLKRDEKEGGRRFGSHRSHHNMQGTKHATKRTATPTEKAVQARTMVPMVKGILTERMKVTKMPAAIWNERYK